MGTDIAAGVRMSTDRSVLLLLASNLVTLVLIVWQQ